MLHCQLLGPQQRFAIYNDGTIHLTGSRSRVSISLTGIVRSIQIIAIGAFGSPQSTYSGPVGLKGRARVAVITVIPEEFSAAQDVFDLRRNIPETPYFVQTDPSFGDWDIVLTQATDRTNVPLSGDISTLIQDLRPQVLILLGEVDVRYGAIRSLVEMASSAEIGLRDSIFDAIAKRSEKISVDERVATELARALLIDVSKAPENWISKIKAISRCMFRANENMESRDAWRSVVTRAEMIYVQ